MIDYLICTIFFVLFTVMLYALGTVILKKEDVSEALISGYLVYSFPVAVGGITVQLLNLPWACFAVFLAALWGVLAAVMVYRGKKDQIKIAAVSSMKQYLSENWMVLFVMVVLIGLTCLYYAGYWLGNHQDDGYYISKIATLPYTQTGGNFMYPLGVSDQGFNSYIVNTWEIEASVYIWLLKVSPTLYLRLFQSAFTFFLYLNLIKAIAGKVIKRVDLKINLAAAQLPVVIVLLFDAHYLFLSDTGLFRLRDMFMVNTGMFLGNSVVRVLGIPLLLYCVMELEKISAKMIVNAAVVSVVLMSKSTIALPVIGIMAAAVCVTWLFFEYGKKGRAGACGIAILYALAAIFLPNKEGIQSISWADMTNALHSPIVWVCLVIFLGSFGLKNKFVYKINTIIILMGILIITPQINDLFEALSIYGFVAGRAVANYVYFFVVINMVYLILLLAKCSVRVCWIQRLYLGLAVCLTVTALLGFKLFGGGVILDQEREGANIRYSLAVIKHNPYFMPNSTIELGEKLDEISKDYPEKLQVVCSKMTIRDGELHPLSVFLRIYAKDIIPVSATERYRADDGTALYDYTQTAFDAFESELSDETAEAFWEEIQDLNVQCIVVQRAECAPWLEKAGYELKDEVEGFYYIWCKND